MQEKILAFNVSPGKSSDELYLVATYADYDGYAKARVVFFEKPYTGFNRSKNFYVENHQCGSVVATSATYFVLGCPNAFDKTGLVHIYHMDTVVRDSSSEVAQ